MRKIKKIFAASTMAVMLMLPTYGAMASSVHLLTLHLQLYHMQKNGKE